MLNTPTTAANLQAWTISSNSYIATRQRCARQAALERQDLSCTYLAHHELESDFVVVSTIVIFITITTTVVIIVIIVIILTVH